MAKISNQIAEYLVDLLILLEKRSISPSIKSQCQNTRSGSLCCHRQPILILNMTLIEQILIRKPLIPLITKQQTEKKSNFALFCFFPIFVSNCHRGGRILGRDALYKLKTKGTSISQETYI